mgnify:CR=1 FL=1
MGFEKGKNNSDRSRCLSQGDGKKYIRQSRGFVREQHRKRMAQ